MAVTPQDVAIELGVPTPSVATGQAVQWSSWIARAVRLVERRAAALGVDLASIPADDVDSVVVRAVAAHVRRPDDATRVEVSVDDGRTARTYRSSDGEVSIKDRWWDELGLLDAQDAEAYSVQATFEPDIARPDLWWP